MSAKHSPTSRRVSGITPAGVSTETEVYFCLLGGGVHKTYENNISILPFLSRGYFNSLFEMSFFFRFFQGQKTFDGKKAKTPNKSVESNTRRNTFRKTAAEFMNLVLFL